MAHFASTYLEFNLRKEEVNINKLSYFKILSFSKFLVVFMTYNFPENKKHFAVHSEAIKTIN